MSKTKMLNKTMTTILITLLTLPILLAVIPRASAISVASCVPGSGPIGTTVTITGTGASAGGSIYVYWDNLGGAVVNSTAYANGAGAYSVMATIPTAGGGLHSIIVKDVSTGGTIGTTFIITPTLTLTPTSGIAGDTVSVTGTGYAASSNMSIFFGTPTVRLIQSGTSTATWYNDTTATGTPALMDVVKLVGAASSDARASVVIPANPANETLAAFTITAVSFKYNTTSALPKPDLELRFVAPNCIDPDDEAATTTRGHVDITLSMAGSTAGTKTWETAAYTGSSPVFVFGNDALDGSSFSYVGTWDSAITWLGTNIHGTPALSTWNLTRISPQAGWTPIGTYYVDTVVYEDATYDLEPPINTTMSNALGSISTTFTVPTGATGANRVSAINVTDLFANATFTVGPAITLTPSTGPAGTVVTITGRGYDDGLEVVTITVGETSAPLNATITKTAYGNFTGQFIVPTHAIGQDLDVIATSGAEHSHATFNVTGNTAITLTPTTGAAGTVVTIEGANFTAIAGKTVTVDFGAILGWTTFSTNATGGFSGTFTVPSLTAASYTVTATDTNILTANTPFVIAVTFLGISPVKGPTGTLATVTGYGFSGGTANVTIGTLRVLTNILDTALVAGTTFYVPTLPVGNYTVTALDTGLLTASTNYEVNATTALTLNSSSAIAGAIVLLDASSFKISQALTFTFKNATYTQALTLAAFSADWTGQTTNSTGYYKGTFIVPTLAIGSYTINATDAHNCTAEVPFSVVLAVPTITLNPTESLIGAVVTVTGTTFTASTAVNIYFGSTLVRTVDSTSGGALPSDANFTVPDVSYGTYTVNASDGVNSATTTFNVLSVHGIDTIQAIVTAIEAKLDQYGSFWNFTNTWFTTISNKLGVFTGTDTVASLLYDIKTSVIAINFTSIDNKLGTFSGTDTVASLLYNIKTSVSTINWTDITAIKAKTDTINWADITSIKSTTTLSIDYLWGLQDHPLWGLRTVVVPLLQSIKNATQFTAGTYSTIVPTSATPVDLGKSSKITLTVRATDDTTEGFVIKAYIYDGTAWRPLSFSVSGIASSDCAATVAFTTGADGRLYFETTGATFTAFIYTAESAP